MALLLKIYLIIGILIRKGETTESSGEKKSAMIIQRENEEKSTWNSASGVEANLTIAIRDVVLGLPVPHVNLLFDNFSDFHFREDLIKGLHRAEITTSTYIMNDQAVQKQFCEYVRHSLNKYRDVTNIIFSNRDTGADLFWELQQRDLIHKKALYIFYSRSQPTENEFYTDHYEAMKVVVISGTKSNIYRIYYSQADALTPGASILVNWWAPGQGLFRHPLLPHSDKVYENFKGRLFEVPVIHKPPWHFVEYTNDSFKPDGGRDDKLLAVIAEKLNFRYKYVDPPNRLQGSGFAENGTFPGVLGQVWQREVDFFMGDVTITFDRSKSVEFSFFTLVDSEAFVTHRPRKLNEAFALIRPFRWQVWPAIVATLALYGPFLFLIIDLPYAWTKKKRPHKRSNLFWKCAWLSLSTFLRQGGVYPAKSHKIRLLLILATLGATYVIGDIYSANLTSLLARPGREKPITTLEQLESAMKTRGYELFLEKHSSSYSTLRNGTGIYERVWKQMQKQKHFEIESVESGMKLVRKKKNVAILGGRETLFFDIKRFGSYNFQLSEKLNTRYSGIAMQIGCPFLENFNRILMQLFEGGILGKMTEEEYERLGEKQRAAAGKREHEEISPSAKGIQKSDVMAPINEPENKKKDAVQTLGFSSHHKLQPLNTRMLQGAFYILLIGYFVSSIALLVEIRVNKRGCMFTCSKSRHRDGKTSENGLFHFRLKFIMNLLNDLHRNGDLTKKKHAENRNNKIK